MKERRIDPKSAVDFLKVNHSKCMQYITSESVLQTLSVVLYDAKSRKCYPSIIDTSQSAGRMPMKTTNDDAPCITSWTWIDMRHRSSV